MFFDKFKKKAEPVEKDNVDKLWDLYSSGELDNINRDVYWLCDYESGINGEGHSGYIFNSDSDATDIGESIKKLLPVEFYNHFCKAVEAVDTEAESIVCEEADQYFYKNEQVVLEIIKKYADQIMN